MKKTIFVLIILVAYILTGCSNPENNQTENTGFSISNWSSSLGAVSESQAKENNSDETKFSYTLYLTSKTEKLTEVKEIKTIVGSNISDKIISNELPVFDVKDNYIEVKGNIVFITKGLTKEQIMALEPYITSVAIVMNDKREFTVELDVTK